MPHKDPEKRREYMRRWHDAHPDYSKRKYAANLEKARSQKRKSEAKRKAENPEKVREEWRRARAKWLAKNPEARARLRALWRQYAKANPQKMLERKKRWRAERIASNPEKVRSQERVANRRHRAENLEKYRAYSRRWHAANKDNAVERRQRRRARQAAAPGQFTAADWRTLIARSKHCHWCKQLFTKKRKPNGTLGPATHDHVIPLSKGGENTLENSVCAHLQCNITKGARLLNPVTGQGILL